LTKYKLCEVTQAPEGSICKPEKDAEFGIATPGNMAITHNDDNFIIS
jgi:hypothetical protein